MLSPKFSVVFLLCIFFPCVAAAAIDLPWSTTYNCADWNQFSDPLNCDGISKKGSWTATPGSYSEQITSAANYPGGDGGKGQRHWVGDGTNNNSGSIQINFNTNQSRIWMRWYQRWQSGFTSNWDTFKNVWFEANTSSRMVFHTGRPGIGGIDLNPPDGNTSVSNVAYGSSFYQGGTSDGSWHCFEVFLDLPNSTWRVWINGNLVAESTTVNFSGATSVQYIILPENVKNVSNGQVMYIDFDDVAITNSTPSGRDASGNPYIGPIGGGLKDTTPPSVSVTSPTDGSTISGIVSLSANASDDTAVAGVQFLVDGNPIGSEITSSPYSHNLDTTTLSDGNHSVTATARDSAGNQQTSTAIQLSVNNGSGSGSGDSPVPPEAILFSESFDDTNFAGRGWYDNSGAQIIDQTQYAPAGGSTSSVKYHFNQGATMPDSGGSVRHKFTGSESVYVEYWVKYSSGYQGSGVSSHPHEFFLLSDADADYTSPNYSEFQVKIEQNNLAPRVIFRDDKAVNTTLGTLPINLVTTTEDRSIHGCNGEQDGYQTDCYQSNGKWYNSKHFLHTSSVISDNTWHKIGVFIKLNTVSGNTTNADGILKYWLDDTLIFDYSNIVMRTSHRPTIKLDKFGIAPYIGVGSPIDQTMWVDELLIASEYPGQSSPIATPINFKIAP